MQLDATLTAAQQNVLNHLAAGKSVAETAELCGVHRNTIANWRREIPAFTIQLDEAIHERTLLFQETGARRNCRFTHNPAQRKSLAVGPPPRRSDRSQNGDPVPTQEFRTKPHKRAHRRTPDQIGFVHSRR